MSCVFCVRSSIWTHNFPPDNGIEGLPIEDLVDELPNSVYLHFPDQGEEKGLNM